MHCNRAEATSGRKDGLVSLNHRTLLRIAGVTAIALTAANCSSNVRGGIDPKYGVAPSPKMVADGQPVPKGGGRDMVGKPYTIAGRTYVPSETPRAAEGLASWYGPSFHGRMTANGEIFDRDSVAAAHTTMPLPSYAKVTNLTTGRSLVVRVNDRGPFVNDRVIDLSRRSAEILEVKHKGTAKVRVQYIGRAPLNDQGHHLMAMNEELRRGTPMHQMVASADMRAGRGGGKGSLPVPAEIMVAEGKPAPAPAPSPAPVMVAEHKPGAAPAQAPFMMASSQPAPAQRRVVTTGSTPAAHAHMAGNQAVRPAGVSNGSGFYIQAAALSNADNAERARNTLSGIGPVEISTLDNGASKLFRVRVGPIGDPGSADMTLRNVIAAGYADARIVPASY